MSPRKPVPKTIPLVWVVGLAIPIMTFIGGMVWNAWTIAGNIATKGELGALRGEMVDGFKKTDEAIVKTLEASKAYSEERSRQGRDEAIAHSDLNRKGMEAEWAPTAAKVDLILKMVEEDHTENRARRPR